MPHIKLAIADDQVLFLKGLKLLIQSFDNMEIVIEAQNGKELIDALAFTQPDVVLTDIKMPVMDGIEATEHIKASYPDIKVILLSMHDDERLIHHMMKIGANGYLLKNEEPGIVKEAIESVVEKDFYFNDYVSKALLTNVSPKNNPQHFIHPPQQQAYLTRRETEILTLICQEYTTADIAEKLFISTRTVEGHRKNLLEKTGVKNTAGLVVYAVRNNLFRLG